MKTYEIIENDSIKLDHEVLKSFLSTYKPLVFTEKDNILIDKMIDSKYFRITASNTEICIGGYDKMPKYFRTVKSAYKYFITL